MCMREYMYMSSWSKLFMRFVNVIKILALTTCYAWSKMSGVLCVYLQDICMCMFVSLFFSTFIKFYVCSFHTAFS